MLNEDHIIESREWLVGQFSKLTDTLDIILPSEYAEQVRYLPPQNTPLPGFYSYNIVPFLREIVDCYSPQSPVREFALMKGLQLGATVGILENGILFYMGHIRNAPVALVTADAELAKLRMDLYITPMINQSGLDDRIKSIDEKNTRKTGKTEKKIEWEGGGFLVPLGAQNPNKSRSLSFQVLQCDEIDGWPDSVGKSGDPCDRIKGRSAAFETTRKIAWISTPLITGMSKIFRAYEKGDRRKYHVPCKHCKKFQELKFNKVNDDGTCYGIQFEVDEEGHLVKDSVVYMCKFCQGVMINEDKGWMLPRGKWVATAHSSDSTYRSYHLSAFYSPVGMQTWTAQVLRWLECWDVVNNRVKDSDKLQVFYNEVLGAPFTIGGQRLKLENVNTHRRAVYTSGMVPNMISAKETGAKIQILICSVDVHKEHLDVQIIGWAPRRCFYSIEWLKLEGDCENLDEDPWKKLRTLIEDKQYRSDDGRLYKIQLTFIDSQYNTDLVHLFCSEYSGGVIPVRGTELPVKGTTFKEFSEFKSKMGQVGYNITTTLYKDRLAMGLKREWDGISLQPNGHPNFPQDYPDQFFKELTIERKQEIKDARTGKTVGFAWVGRGAHAWDTLVYNCAAIDIIALDTCINELGLEEIEWSQFWQLCEEKGLFWEHVSS
ncbi:phage terminase large subunit family protein [Candidatus Pacearchaeota archaeon]|nr:phage terminase large subunit family protein [Candidatus Pacearchaeota archaeon]